MLLHGKAKIFVFFGIISSSKLFGDHGFNTTASVTRKPRGKIVDPIAFKFDTCINITGGMYR